MNPDQIESLVKQVIAQMSAMPAASAVPATARIAMLTGERKIEVKEVSIPQVGDDEILVKVEEGRSLRTDSRGPWARGHRRGSRSG